MTEKKKNLIEMMAAKLRRAVEDKNITYEELARRAIDDDGKPISIVTVNRLMNARVDPRLSSIAAIAKALDLKLSDLLP